MRKKIIIETENNLKLDNSEDTKYQDLYNVVKVILQLKFKTLNIYISDEERLKIDKPNVQLK